MSWPLASHFSAMLQNPKVAFRDPKLQACRIEKDGMNQPRPWSGAFAVVYKGIDANERDAFALRVFTTESPERRERYDLISAYLKTRKLKCLVDFEYRDRSIRSAGDGKFYPLIVMEWVPGDTLFNWVRARCQAGDRAALGTAAQRWVATVKELADAQIAHGDLQHANVMVTDDGQIKLVDYDGMCVPELIGRRNLEIGVEPYQHPGRGETTLLSLELDHYSALVIYVALRALAANPDLWIRYVEEPGHDKLLFRKEDLRMHAGSALYSELKNSPDPEVRELIDKLIQATHGAMDQVPALAQLTNSFAQIEEHLRRQEWEAAVDLLNRRRHFRDAPDELKPLINRAFEYVCRKQAWTKFQRVPEELSEACDRQVVQAWNEPLFAGFDQAEAQRNRIAAARQRLDILERVGHILQQAGEKSSLKAERLLAQLAEKLPPGYRHGQEQRLRLAERRAEAIAQLREALQQNEEAALVSAWQALARAQGEELVSDPAVRARVELAGHRVPLIEALQQIPLKLPPDQLDRRILSVWREEYLGGCPAAAAWRTLYEAAAVRRNLLAQLQTAVDARNAPVILELVQHAALTNYPLLAAWSTLIKTIRERAARCDALVAVLRDAQREQFLTRFDARLVRQYPDRFQPYHELLAAWVAWEVVPLAQIGLAPAVGRASLVRVDEPRGAYRVRWTWPQARFSDDCMLAICPRAPAPDEDPAHVENVYSVGIDRANWEGGGGSRLLYPEVEWSNCHVVVWARVNLGFQAFYSHPLILGTIDDRRGWKAWLPFGRAGAKPAGAAEPAAETAVEPVAEVPQPQPDTEGARADE